MPSRFASKAINDTPAASSTPDWKAVKEAINKGVDLKAEFADLGVKFTGIERGDRWECWAHEEIRIESAPSAVIFADKGTYYDSNSGEKPIHLVDLAVKLNRFPKWGIAIKHYADKVNYPLGSVRESKGLYPDGHFDYTKADGSASYRVYRYITVGAGKSFKQYPLNEDGSVNWKAGEMSVIAPLPYRLDHFKDAENTWLFVTEGERKCEALAALGLAATTAHGGAGSARKNWPLIAPYFAGCDVVILPDNDPPGKNRGRSYADSACVALAGVAASIRRIDLPGLLNKGDIQDWLEAGNTRSQLEALAEAAPLWSPGEAKEDDPVSDDLASRDATLADLRLTLSADAWIWTGWIAQGALCLFAAEGGTGKTRTLMDLHRRAFYGLPWPDGEIRPVGDRPKVLWILADGQHQQVCDTAIEFGIPDDCIILNTMASDPHGGTSLETADQLADFEERIERNRPTWVVIDTITNTGDFKPQDAVDAKRQYKPLQEIASKHLVPIIPVTHLNAGGKALGKRVTEKVRTVINLTCPDPDGQPDRRKMWVDKSFAVKPPALGITFGDSGHEYDDAPPMVPDGNENATPRRGPVPAKIKACMEWLDQAIGSNSVRIVEMLEAGEALEYPKTTIFRAADNLKLIKSDSSTGRGKLWSKPPANPPF